MVVALVLAAVMQVFSQDIIPEPENIGYIKKDSVSNAEKYVTVDNVIVVGNQITKSSIILRELDVKKGQTIVYDELIKQLKKDQERVNNLKLFNTVEVDPIPLEDDRVLIVVEVSERWYIFPVPLFDIVDRNFNVWWEQHDHDLSRVNYGFKLYQYNFRGRNEKLKLTLQFGYTKKFGLHYSIPYLDKAQRHGLIIDGDYSENKNIAYHTEDHVQRFMDSENVLRSSIDAGVSYVYRNAYQSFHYFGAKYNNNRISDTVAALNPNYFRFGKTQQQYFEVFYDFVRDKRDVQAYPLNGYYLEAGIWQSGLGIYNDLSLTTIRAKYARYLDLKKNWYFSNYSSLYTSLPEEQPYNNYYAVGYKNDVIRGYELYLIEGPHFLLNKSTLKKRVLSINESLDFIPVKQFRHFPLDIYLKSYLDLGYVKNFEGYGENTRLSDNYLLGTGVGADIHTLYDMVIRLEYSVNKDLESGFFFHLKREF